MWDMRSMNLLLKILESLYNIHWTYFIAWTLKQMLVKEENNTFIQERHVKEGFIVTFCFSFVQIYQFDDAYYLIWRDFILYPPLNFFHFNWNGLVPFWTFLSKIIFSKLLHRILWHGVQKKVLSIYLFIYLFFCKIMRIKPREICAKFRRQI